MGYAWKDYDIADTTATTCPNCGWIGPAKDLDEITDFGERIDAGAEVPAGQCPECGACAYLVKKPPHLRIGKE